MSGKFSDEDKKTIDDLVNEGLQFIESNPDAEAAESEAKQKELEAKFNPIMQKVYQQSAPTGAADADMRAGAEHQSAPEADVHDLD